MSVYKIAVVADETAPAAGTAVVRIEGLTRWPANATLRLLPIDEAAVPPKSDGWPWGEIQPLRVEPTESGVDIVLGPEVVNCARLLPGTPLTIKVAAADLEIETRWPSIAPTTRRRGAAVAMSATQLLAAKAEREKAEKITTARRHELAEFATKSVRDAATDAQISRTSAAPPRPKETGQLARLLPLRRPESPMLEKVPLSQGQLAKLAVAPPGNVVPLPAPVPTYPKATRTRWAIRGFAAGLSTMATVVVGFLTLAPQSWLPPAVVATTATGVSADQIGMADLQSVFKDLAATGTVSPRRKSANNVDMATALSLADHSLRGQRTPAETEEAEFWLKRALAANFGGADIGWALTQLGTVYAAEGSPQHSYVKAHTIWELAAAQGDPVAHCFLGALYEHGLGVAKNRKAAREHYQTADALGACRSAKDAAARLKE